MARGGMWIWAVHFIVISDLLASFSPRQLVLASHTNGPNNTSPSNKPAIDVTPWRTWNRQHVANYDFRDTSQQQSSPNGPLEHISHDRSPQVETLKRVLIGSWNVKKKATQVEATIFDNADKTQWSESRTIPSKFILEMKLYTDLASVTNDQLTGLRTTLATLLNVPLTNVVFLKPKPDTRTLEMYFVRPGSEPVVPPVGENLFLARDVERLLASQRPTSPVPGLDTQSLFSQYNPDSDMIMSRKIPVYMPDYFPLGCVIIMVLLTLLLVASVWWLLHRRTPEAVKGADNKLSPLYTHPDVLQQICMYPCAKPSVNSVTTIQPDPVSNPGSMSTFVVSFGSPLHCGSPPDSSANESGTPSYSSGSSPGTPVIGTPVRACSPPLHASPLKMKTRRLLERRGSNVSLTIDLGPGIHECTVGSPPKESSVEEYLLSAGNRMSRKQIRSCVKNPAALYEEFWEIPMNHPDRIAVAGSGLKNRYRSIIPNESTRVKLPVDGEDELCGYINANYVRGYAGEERAYIATQGPMPNTIHDLWRMACLEKAPVVVMITKLREKSKTKCAAYIPDEFGVYGDVTVNVRSVSEQDGYVQRYLTIKYKDKEHFLLHAWYTAWPDHKAPDTARQLLNLVKEVDMHRYDPETGRPKGPVIVHCSAGIGRSGCFIATSIGLQQLREEHMVDVLGIVCAMRMDRGGLVQTNEQYRFVHQALCLYEKELPSCPSSGE